MTIGQHINLIRNKRDMTLGQLAIISGVSKNTLISWIYYDKSPSIELLVKVADALHISLDELLERELSANIPRGEWIRVAAYKNGPVNTVKCSACDTMQPINSWEYHPYCPYCGTKMKEGAE